MKMFTKEEVIEKIKLFNEHMEEEKKLQQELLDIRMYGSKDATVSASKRTTEIYKEIEHIRMNKMLPIIDELAAFVAHCQKLEKEGKLKKIS
ncbi:MAG: hypothetical protein LWY06_02030 [Firmicutes bacterium]|nr:hypothetical protein [Bacillota bacterium]